MIGAFRRDRHWPDLAELHFDPALVDSFQRLKFAMFPGTDLAI